MTGGDDRLAFVDRNAHDPLGRQHPPAGAGPVDLRHVEVGILGEVLGQLRGGGGLEPEVHFHFDRLCQHADRFHRLETPPFRASGLDQFRDPEEEIEVTGESLFDPGPQNLDRDFATVGTDREMNLGDRRRGDGFVVEPLEQRTPSARPTGPR